MIGVIDSGLGGLTALSALRRALPAAAIRYFADTAHAPYGGHGPERIGRWTEATARAAAAAGAQLLVVASHSMACAGDGPWREALGIPVVDIAAACLEAAVRRSRKGRIGLVASPAVVESGRYTAMLAQRAPTMRLTAVSCPVLPLLVAEGWLTRRETVLLVKRCVRPLRLAQVDAVILGGGHLAALRPVFQRKLGARVALVDGSAELAGAAAESGAACGAAAEGRAAGPGLRLAVSELTARVQRTAGVLLGGRPDLETYGEEIA